MKLIFRRETPADHRAVEEMTRQAFWRFWEPDRKICDEHLLVHKLRQCPSFVPELNNIAQIDGQIVGHIIYTRSKIVSDAGHETETLTFGPLTVLPELQSKGIGRALMSYTFEEARKLGCRAVIIFGHPDYYPRAGFRRAVEFGITTADGQTFDALMAYPLYNGALDGIHGKYYIDPVYEQLSQEDAMEFDKGFPSKAPHVPIPIGVLLDRLEPDAVNAIRAQKFQNFEEIRSRSERELLSIPGIGLKALETIRAIMRENGRRWGKNSYTNGG